MIGGGFVDGGIEFVAQRCCESRFVARFPAHGVNQGRPQIRAVRSQEICKCPGFGREMLLFALSGVEWRACPGFRRLGEVKRAAQTIERFACFERCAAGSRNFCFAGSDIGLLRRASQRCFEPAFGFGELLRACLGQCRGNFARACLTLLYRIPLREPALEVFKVALGRSQSFAVRNRTRLGVGQFPCGIRRGVLQRARFLVQARKRRTCISVEFLLARQIANSLTNIYA